MKFCWVTINVRDLEKSLHFYQEIIGLNIHKRMKPKAFLFVNGYMKLFT